METLLDRFCRYVKVDTTAVEETDKYPSSPGQLELGKMLAEELKAFKLENVSQNEAGIVMGTIPGNVNGAPTIAFLAHMDTSPEAVGLNVKPQLIEKYDGNDIILPGDKTKVIKVDRFPQLKGMKGKTLITSDGTTLLGADDKAGVAVIMDLVQHLTAHPEIKHGPIRIVFTCDEEVGRGTDKVDIKKIDATAAYTLDGEGEGGLENETFSADQATVKITGANIHPGYAKGKMINAMRLAAEFISRMPWQRMAPETTDGREPFLHPYVIKGGVPEVEIKILLRSFVTDDLATEAQVLHQVKETILAEHPGAKIDIDIKKQYRNMIEHLRKEPRAEKLAEQAIRNAGLTPKFEAIRGGTDGSRLSEIGLPTPNLSVGMHNFHSPLEFACLDEMKNAAKVLVELVQLWGKEK